MENGHTENSQPRECVELPSLIKAISINEVDGFDTLEDNNFVDIFVAGIEKADVRSVSDLVEPISNKKIHAVSISMPPSPVHRSEKKVNFGETTTSTGTSETVGTALKKTRFYSQPMPKGTVPGEVRHNSESQNPASNSTEKNDSKFYSQPMPRGSENNLGNASNPRIHRLKDKRYDSFKTFSGKLERQISNLRGRTTHESVPEEDDSQNLETIVTMPVDRYYDALQGPELETLRDSEEIVLPEDRLWPFLLRYPISSFGICLGVSSQAIMWKTLASSTSTSFLHISPMVNMVLWFISVALMIIVASAYILKVIFYFEAVRREYYHPIRVNFFFAPWIALLFLVQGIPTSFAEKPPHALWYVLMAPIFCLELKIYGQWMSGGQRRLSKVANPSNHLSIVGNFVGALLGASMGLKEGPIFFFAVGLAHYIVLFVTLYQRLPTNETLPKELHPVFFLFVAAPNVASIAWSTIQGSFDYGSRIAYFIGLFLYFSLAVRVNFFRGFRFSLSWWAYTFPMTGAAIATMKYSNQVTNVVTQALSVILCAVSTLTVTALLVSTILHAFVFGDLFPNDIAIAISDSKPMQQNKWFHLRRGSSEAKDIENYLKFVTSNDKDIEGALKPPSPPKSRDLEAQNSL